MKEFTISIIIAIISIAAFIAASTSNRLDDYLAANIEALASIEDPISTCNTYCEDRLSWVCVLTTIYGYDINCIDMYLKPEYQ